MLALTEDAVAAVMDIVASAGLPPGAGLRITREVAADEVGGSRHDLRLSLVEAPLEGDEVLEQERIFVDPDAAGLLEGRLLDADRVEGEIRFSLDHQA